MALTLQQRLTKLKEFILKYNTYFEMGFEDVFLHENGYVANDVPVFPADNLGSYFYLRLPNALQADYANRYSIADSALGIGVRYDIVLVACVNDSDCSLLLENLITTIGQYQDEDIKITKMLYNPDDVVTQELGKIGKENLEAALQRFPDNIGIASISFSFTTPFVLQSLNCIKNPCIQC